MSVRSSRRLAAAVAVLAVVAWVAAAANARSEANIYSVHQLVADAAAAGAPTVDASLVNGWGLSAGPTTPWWTSNNGSNTSTLYSGAGVKSALTVAVPGGPTGTVFNGNADGVRGQPERQVGCGAVPVRHRGRHDPRLVADGERHGGCRWR